MLVSENMLKWALRFYPPLLLQRIWIIKFTCQTDLCPDINISEDKISEAGEMLNITRKYIGFHDMELVRKMTIYAYQLKLKFILEI